MTVAKELYTYPGLVKESYGLGEADKPQDRLESKIKQYKEIIMDLSNLHPPLGSRKKNKRVGRGESSGWGKTSGKGHKGQNARSGTGGKVGFEGGQMPLIRRLPKFGFTNSLRTPTKTVSLTQLNNFDEGATVTVEALKEKKIIPSKFKGRVKILNNGAIEKKLTVDVQRISASAKAAIEKAGGTVTTKEEAKA